VESGSNKALAVFKRKLIKPPGTSPSLLTPRGIDTLTITETLQPLKSGWLLKKRDLFSGWRCRYFVVYVGKVEYYIDQHDTTPRGVVPIFGAEVSRPKKIFINGDGDHWGIM
jgi:hypothetical protein